MFNSLVSRKDDRRPSKRSRTLKGSNLFQHFGAGGKSNESNNTLSPHQTSSQYSTLISDSMHTRPAQSSPTVPTNTLLVQSAPPPAFDKKSKSTLFGAVMDHNQQQQKHTHELLVENNEAHLLNVNSPGGEQFLSFLKKTADSPWDQSPQSRDKSLPSPLSSESITSLSPESTPGAWREWHETRINNSTIGIIDWTLLHSLNFDTQPKLQALKQKDDPLIKQKAMQYFLADSLDAVSMNVKPEVALYSGLYYWQHPHESSISENEDSGTPGRSQVNSSQDDVLGSEPSQLSRLSTKNKRSKSRVSSKASLFSSVVTDDGNKNTESKHQRKFKEWQEALKALYQSFVARAQQLEDLIKSQQEVNMQPIVDSAFYIIGDQQTLLFRLGVEKLNNVDEICPEVLLSSSSSQLRDMLRNKGFALHLLYTMDEFTDTKFEESMIYLPLKPVNNDPANCPSVQAELSALRQEQTTRQHVGPDVSVSMFSKKSTARVMRQIPPLRIRGWKDCEALFDIFHDFYGNVPFKSCCSVPLLVCRKLGPFLHSSLKSLTLNQKQFTTDFEISNNNSSFQVIGGVILPCAVRTLVSAITANLRAQALESDTSNKSPSANTEKVSHHLVAKPVSFQASQFLMAGHIGVTGSDHFNTKSKQFNDKSDFLQQCARGECTKMIVWDNSKPGLLAYKVERMNSAVPR